MNIINDQKPHPKGEVKKSIPRVIPYFPPPMPVQGVVGHHFDRQCVNTTAKKIIVPNW
jgi:hypothetical protein